jgi:hypothetical protein
VPDDLVSCDADTRRVVSVSGFQVGLGELIVNSRYSPTALARADYLTAVTSGVDSFWVGDHLNALFPRSIFTPQYLGVARLRLGVGVTDASGRAILGIGVGEREGNEPCGIDWTARYFLRHAGWRNDLSHGLAMARNTDPISYAALVTYSYGLGIIYGVVRPDDRAMRETEDALRIAERSGDVLALVWAQTTLGAALVHRHTAAGRDRGHKLLTAISEVLRRRGHNLGDLPLIDVYSARENARRGNRDDAIPVMRAALDHLIRAGQLLAWGVPETGVLAERLLDRGGENDVAEAEAAIERLAAAPSEDGVALRDIWLPRLRTLPARACGDEAAYRDYRDRYRDMAKSLGFEGHMKWAEAMP